jgi:ABC-type polysaccharide transport system permease subunit
MGEVQSCLTVQIAEAPTTGAEQIQQIMQMFIPMMLMLVMANLVMQVGDMLGGEYG